MSTEFAESCELVPIINKVQAEQPDYCEGLVWYDTDTGLTNIGIGGVFVPLTGLLPWSVTDIQTVVYKASDREIVRVDPS